MEKVLVLLSGGIDSPVACFYMMKRGVALETIHFASFPYTSKAAEEKVNKVADAAKELSDSLLHFRQNGFPCLSHFLLDLPGNIHCAFQLAAKPDAGLPAGPIIRIIGYHNRLLAM